jgi:hypothetical protein
MAHEDQFTGNGSCFYGSGISQAAFSSRKGGYRLNLWSKRPRLGVRSLWGMRGDASQNE